MAELADALDLGSNAPWHAGSTPVIRTTTILMKYQNAIKSYRNKRQLSADTCLFFIKNDQLRS